MIEREPSGLTKQNESGTLLTKELEEIAVENLNSKEAAHKLDVNFLYVEHTPEHVDEIIATLKDRDVIYLEAVMPDALERERYERAISMITDPAFDGEIDAHIDQRAGEYFIAMFRGLQASGKEVHLIDVDQNDPMYTELHSQMQGSLKEFRQAMLMFEDPAIIRDTLKYMVTATGRAIRYRDDQIQIQLTMIISAMQKTQDHRKIGVVQGAVHTRSSYALANDSAFDVSRKFIGPEGADPGQSASYTYMDQLIREQALVLDNDSDEPTLNRAILEDYTIAYLKDALPSSSLSRAWVQSLTDEQVHNIIEHVYEIGNYTESSDRRANRKMRREKQQVVREYLESMHRLTQ